MVEAIFDIITAIDEPAGNAANAAVKIFELRRRGDRNTIKRALQVLKTRCIHSMPTSDLSTLSDPQLSMMMVTNAEIFAHFEATERRRCCLDLPALISTEATNSLLCDSRGDTS